MASATILDQRVRVIQVVFAGGLGCLASIYGVLLLCSPDLILRFHDRLTPGDHRGRNAEWRSHVHEKGYWFAGIGFAGVGVLVLVFLAKTEFGWFPDIRFAGNQSDQMSSLF